MITKYDLFDSTIIDIDHFGHQAPTSSFDGNSLLGEPPLPCSQEICFRKKANQLLGVEYITQGKSMDTIHPPSTALDSRVTIQST
jgi:hypothetical protein